VLTLSLSYVPPYDWPAIRAFFGARAIPGVERVESDSYLRTITLQGASGTVEVRPLSGRNALEARIRFPLVTALSTIVTRIRRMFDLDADLRVIHTTLRRDPLLAKLVDARPGLRVPGAWDPFELAVRAILGQQISVEAARGLAAKLVHAYGERFPGERVDHVFPPAEVLAEVNLSTLGMPRARSSALSALARVVQGDDRFFDPRSHEVTLQRLRSLPGVGEWTAQYIALRALRDPDAFPASDIGLLRGAAEQGRRPTSAELLARSEAWRPWRAYAAQHLWAADGQLLRRGAERQGWPRSMARLWMLGCATPGTT
jgi:AraC family transcriptional regulator of adaptative response / DNA-3-methyladenine glycosylase II